MSKIAIRFIMILLLVLANKPPAFNSVVDQVYYIVFENILIDTISLSTYHGERFCLFQVSELSNRPSEAVFRLLDDLKCPFCECSGYRNIPADTIAIVVGPCRYQGNGEMDIGVIVTGQSIGTGIWRYSLTHIQSSWKIRCRQPGEHPALDSYARFNDAAT